MGYGIAEGSNNFLADAISRIKTNIYIYIYDPIEDPKKLKVSKREHVTEVNASKMQTFDSNVLCAEQKWDITCKKLTLQSHYGNKNTSNTVWIFASDTLQK